MISGAPRCPLLRRLINFLMLATAGTMGLNSSSYDPVGGRRFKLQARSVTELEPPLCHEEGPRGVGQKLCKCVGQLSHLPVLAIARTMGSNSV